jgi:hypothetical protein
MSILKYSEWLDIYADTLPEGVDEFEMYQDYVEECEDRYLEELQEDKLWNGEENEEK